MHQETTYVPAQTNHVLHLLLTFATCGAWALVWLIVAAVNSNRTVPQVTWVTTPYTPSRPVGAYEPGQAWIPDIIERAGYPPAQEEFVERKEAT